MIAADPGAGQDRKLVDPRRRNQMKAAFALQLVTVRWPGTFLEDPLDVPGEVLDFVAGQLGVADPAVVKRYAGRVKPKSDHQREIRQAHGLREDGFTCQDLVIWRFTYHSWLWSTRRGPRTPLARSAR